MITKTDRELESAEEWDLENAELVRPEKKARAVVSVAFSRADHDRVAKSAEELGTKISTYIRQAALEKASGQTKARTSNWTVGSPSGSVMITAEPTSGTRGAPVTQEPALIVLR